jgi:S-ribosylhomocysteine lyase LuxS involved in autoinducer biosynthesis
LLQMTSNSKCTDPRDKVYALLGLSADCQNGKFVVDYSQGMEHLYVSLWKFYVCHTSPSMVMHGSHILERLLASSMDRRDDQYLPQVDLDVVGWAKGTIVYVGQPWANHEIAEAWYQELNKLTESHDENTPPMAVERNYQRFCSALCQATASDTERIRMPRPSEASEANRQRLQSVTRRKPAYKKDDITFESFDLPNSSFWETDGDDVEYKQHHIFISDSGHFGIAPVGTMLGDKICQFEDSDMTAIVRSSTTTRQPKTELIGKALLARTRAADDATRLESWSGIRTVSSFDNAIVRAMENMPTLRMGVNSRRVSLRISSVTLRWLTREASSDEEYIES